ncbi:5263_t:CDS:2, partial [Gigaspora rosea]
PVRFGLSTYLYRVLPSGSHHDQPKPSYTLPYWFPSHGSASVQDSLSSSSMKLSHMDRGEADRSPPTITISSWVITLHSPHVQCIVITFSLSQGSRLTNMSVALKNAYF